ncbi:heterokaryon incompatibility protein-domain-containing protein [Apiospora sp. TS-2023a]
MDPKSSRAISNEPMLLTKDTYAIYQDCIPIEDLPRKYIDAVQAAHQLGVQYLWIDSLCIIQDDQQDWEIESAQMHRVYRHSYCNLSATSSTSSNEGLFYERDATWLRSHVIIPGNDMDPAMVTQEMDEEWYSRLDEEPLYSRGWVCQERLLSTRNVSFARHLVYFKCAKEMSSELSGDHEYISEKNIRNRIRTVDRQLFSLRTLGNYQFPSLAWNNIVAFYSGCDLANPTDKLVVISGVARVFHERMKSTYLAGIWFRDLLEGLTWRRSIRSTLSRARYTEYIAPSWSWASINAQVDYELIFNQYHYLADCEEASTVPYGTDPLGRVRSGSLRLRCCPIPLLLDYDKFRMYKNCHEVELLRQMESALEAFVPIGHTTGHPVT